MRRKLEPLRLRMQKLKRETIKQKVAVYEVEPEIVRQASLYASLWMQRYKQDPRKNWTALQAYNDLVALIGEEVMHVTLEEFDIYHKRADPLFPREDPRADKPWDFYVLDFGSIEVKTGPPLKSYHRLMVRLDTYAGADYYVVIKLFPEMEPQITDGIKELEEAEALLSDVKEAKFMGWLTKNQVEQLPTRNFGKAECYWTFYEELNPMWEFFDKILKN